MVGRGEVTDRAWVAVEPSLPPQVMAGRPWRDHRQVINGILWKLRTGGAPWRDLLERYGPWKTCHERLRVWTFDGTWAKVLTAVHVKDDSVGAVEWVVSIDSALSWGHQHAAGARKRGTAGRGRSAPSRSMEKRLDDLTAV